MIRNLIYAVLATLLLGGVAGCGPKSEPGTTPDGAIRTSADLLKQSDIAGLLQHVMPPADFARLKADWGKQARAKPVSDEDRNKFAETMRKLTAPDAETTIYAEIEPKLKEFDAQYQKQLPMYVGMGRGWLTGMVQQSKDLSDSDKVQALAAINAIADWVQKTRFTDPALVRQALAILCKTARELDLKTLDQARSLDFDDSMKKLHIGFMGAKDLLAVYGFSIDQTLDSINPVVVSNDGNSAKVKVGYTLLGAPLSAETEMVDMDGHWYRARLVLKLREHADSASAPNPVSATPAAPVEPVPAPKPDHD
ncbi:MAG: hypothetical protein WBW61_03060 [Rhodanobacteraceae bacterium]